jgi:hypothetical protein
VDTAERGDRGEMRPKDRVTLRITLISTQNGQPMIISFIGFVGREKSFFFPFNDVGFGVKVKK